MWNSSIAIAVVICAGGLFACSGNRRDAPAPATAEGDAAPAGADATFPPDAVPTAEPAGPAFADDIRSLRLKRSIAVRMRPHKDAERYGTIAAGTWVGWKQVIAAPEASGCDKRWVEIEPFGWICEELMQPSKRPPKGVELPRLERAEIVPGVYGQVIGQEPTVFHREESPDETGEMQVQMVPARVLEGSFKVRRYGEIVVEQAPEADPEEQSGQPDADTGGEAAPPDGEAAPPDEATAPPDEAAAQPNEQAEPELESVAYWRINTSAPAEYLPLKSVREYQPSEYRGLRLGDDTGRAMPVGYPRSSDGRIKAKIPVFSAARGGRRVARVPTRTAVPVLEIARDAGQQPIAYRIGENRWVRANQMRLVESVPPPPYTGTHERWFDLNLDTQVLVAYEGSLAVYTTMVATGSRKHPTETGIFRIWVKFAEKNMSDLAGEAPYAVATVPWVQFYDRGFALHTSYWHDKFGTRRSHGCTNLAPADARFLYFWSEPHVPPGWSMAKGTVEHPGSLVRIHSKDDPEPQFRGYALEVMRARQQAESSVPAK